MQSFEKLFKYFLADNFISRFSDDNFFSCHVFLNHRAGNQSLLILTTFLNPFNSIHQENLFSVDIFSHLTMGLMVLLKNWIPCFIGNEIEVNCEMLLIKVYETNWHDFTLKEQKDVLVMQTVLQMQPIKIKVIGDFVINLQTFLSLTNLTYKLIAFLRSFKNKLESFFIQNF